MSDHPLWKYIPSRIAVADNAYDELKSSLGAKRRTLLAAQLGQLNMTRAAMDQLESECWALEWEIDGFLNDEALR